MSLPCPAASCPGTLNIDTDRNRIGVVVESCDTCSYRNQVTPKRRMVTAPTMAQAVCRNCQQEFEYAVDPNAARKQAPQLCPAKCRKKDVRSSRPRHRAVAPILRTA